MGLHIYKGRENLPKDMEYIYDIDAFFVGVKLPDCEFVRKVLREIEKAEYVDEVTYKDRVGRYLYNSTLSSGSKILLAMYLYPSIIFNGIEMGGNCWDYMLSCTKSHVDITYVEVEFGLDLKEPVTLNGESFMSTYRLNEAISDMEV